MLNVQVTDKVRRYLGGTPPPMILEVTAIKDGLIHCGPWTFDIHTGAEVDDELNWGPPPRATGSFITP